MIVICAWFAMCDRPADGAVSHPILGWVPTCRRCATSLDLDLVEGTFEEEASA